jgi:monofunctional biosynthetic peptidoglycan transglycosylase
VINAQNQVPRRIDELSFQPVEDTGVTRLASQQAASDDDCLTRPQEVADPIAAEGTA